MKKQDGIILLVLCMSAAALFASFGAIAVSLQTKAQISSVKVAAARAEPARKVVKGAWPGLGMDKTIALGEAIQKAEATPVMIFCSTDACRDFASDLDDAFQIANWPSDFERRPVMLGDQKGLVIGPPGKAADALRSAVAKVLPDVPVHVEEVETTGKLSVLIGAVPR